MSSACLFTSGLSGFLLQPLADVAYALILVRIRFLQRPNIGGNLSDLLAVDAADDKFCLLIHRNADSRWNRIFDRMREAQGEHDRTLPLFSTITDADNFKFFGETVRDTAHGIRDQSACQAVEGLLRAAVVQTNRLKLFVLVLELDTRRDRIRHRPFRPRDNHRVRLDLDLYLIRHRNGLFSN